MKMTEDPTTMGRATIGPKGRVTIPRLIREQLRVGPGDEIVFHVSDGRAELVPLAVIPRDQVWFYSREMRERVTRAEMEIALGKTTKIPTPEAAQAHLDRLKGRKK
jgi:AbrB family looped-hinge helix DNA binding protein